MERHAVILRVDGTREIRYGSGVIDERDVAMYTYAKVTEEDMKRIQDVRTDVKTELNEILKRYI